jgi:hypothetical protein
VYTSRCLCYCSRPTPSRRPDRRTGRTGSRDCLYSLMNFFPDSLRFVGRRHMSLTLPHGMMVMSVHGRVALCAVSSFSQPSLCHCSIRIFCIASVRRTLTFLVRIVVYVFGRARNFTTVFCILPASRVRLFARAKHRRHLPITCTLMSIGEGSPRKDEKPKIMLGFDFNGRSAHSIVMFGYIGNN